MTLFEATRDLHHACEAHPLGQRMAAGNITRAEWASWLTAFRVLHQVVDPALPAHMHRDTLLAADLSVLPPVLPVRAALTFAHDLCATDTTGTAYAGRRVEILSHEVADGIATLTLLEAPAWLIATGDSFTARAPARDLVFLTHTRHVLEPDLYCSALREACAHLFQLRYAQKLVMTPHQAAV